MNNCEECSTKLNKHSEMFKANIEENAKYTSIVFSLGYASFFLILNVIKNLLPKHFLIASILLMTISLISFIANEIIKMSLHVKYNQVLSKNWKSYIASEKTLFELEQSNIKGFNETFNIYLKFYHPFLF